MVLNSANNLRFLQDIHCIRVNYVQIVGYLFMRTIMTDIGSNSYDMHLIRIRTYDIPNYYKIIGTNYFVATPSKKLPTKS